MASSFFVAIWNRKSYNFLYKWEKYYSEQGEKQMKRILSLLLALVMLMSILSGCGGDGQKETAASIPETVATEVTEAPTTEPTLSPEEILYNGLSERMQQAVDLGLAELS